MAILKEADIVVSGITGARRCMKPHMQQFVQSAHTYSGQTGRPLMICSYGKLITPPGADGADLLSHIYFGAREDQTHARQGSENASCMCRTNLRLYVFFNFGLASESRATHNTLAASQLDNIYASVKHVTSCMFVAVYETSHLRIRKWRI
jgi:hypothetical protein